MYYFIDTLKFVFLLNTGNDPILLCLLWLSCNSWGINFVNSLHAYIFASLKRKKLISTTPLNDALNALILALNASAAAFVLLFTKKFKILS